MGSNTRDNDLGFTADWFNLGVITPADLDTLLEQYQQSDDKNTEHYRWRVFTSFLQRHQQLAPELMRALFQLGQSDHDTTMGTSMQIALLKRPECPIELVRLALESPDKALGKKALEWLETAHRRDSSVQE